MHKRLLMIALFALCGASLASAKTYSFIVIDPSQAGKIQLKPGTYKVKLDGSHALLLDQSGHQINEPVKVQTGDHKYDQTAIETSTANGANRILWVEIGGSKDKVVFQ
jgi:hypothetical protein